MMQQHGQHDYKPVSNMTNSAINQTLYINKLFKDQLSTSTKLHDFVYHAQSTSETTSN